MDGQAVGEHFLKSTLASSYWTYFVNDPLGSVSIITGASGAVAERDSYDAWGKRRNADGTDPASCNITSLTKKGFTNQEQIDALCAVNLNARIYDPVIGRFMAADPVTATPYDAQSLNRYTYVDNRPLSETDPTGKVVVTLGIGGAAALNDWGITGEVGVTVSFPIPFLDPHAKYDAGAYVTYGRASGVILSGGPAISVAPGDVQELNQDSKQLVIATPDVSLFVPAGNRR